MAIGSTYSGSSTDGLVKCSEDGWSLTVVDAKETNTGYMVSGENVLSNELQLCDTENGAYQDADTSLTLVSNGTPTGESGRAFGTYVKQQITYDDVVANDYSIILTFTVSVTV
jgi:hypothetical protein